MHLKYNNGSEAHVRPDLGRELIRAGLATEIPPKQGQSLIDQTRDNLLATLGNAPPPTPQWSIVTIPFSETFLVSGSAQGEETHTKQVLAIRMDVCNTTVHYVGLPEHVNARREWPGGFRYLNGFGREVPEDICKQYKRQWKANDNLRVPATEPGPAPETAAMAREKEMYDRRVAAGNASPGLKI